MSTTRKVVVITGASQGIGAGLVRGFLDRGYGVVANSRSIQPTDSADVLAVAITAHLPGLEPEAAQKIVEAAHERCPYSKATRGNIDVTVSVD